MTVKSLQHARRDPRCIICGASIEAGARKCVTCGFFQDGQTCVSCKLPIPAGAEVCTACKMLQTGDHCRACGAIIVSGSKRCPQCSQWQSWRRFFSGMQVTFALLLAFFSVISAVAPVVIGYLTNYSQTYIRVLGAHDYVEGQQAHETTIAVLAVNNGKRMSYINSAQIALLGDNGWSTPLRVRNVGDQLVQPGKNVVLYFTGSPKTKEGKTPQPPSAPGEKRQVLISTGSPKTKEAKTPPQPSAPGEERQVRISVVVDESDRDGHVVQVSREHVVPARLLSNWIVEHEVKKP